MSAPFVARALRGAGQALRLPLCFLPPPRGYATLRRHANDPVRCRKSVAPAPLAVVRRRRSAAGGIAEAQPLAAKARESDASTSPSWSRDFTFKRKTGSGVAAYFNVPARGIAAAHRRRRHRPAAAAARLRLRASLWSMRRRSAARRHAPQRSLADELASEKLPPKRRRATPTARPRLPGGAVQRRQVPGAHRAPAEAGGAARAQRRGAAQNCVRAVTRALLVQRAARRAKLAKSQGNHRGGDARDSPAIEAALFPSSAPAPAAVAGILA